MSSKRGSSNESGRSKNEPLVQQLSKQSKNWNSISSVDEIEDEQGVYCIKLSSKNGDILTIVKSYSYQDMASFPKRVIENALEADCSLGIFFGDEDFTLGSGYVFNPSFVINEGKRNVTKNAKSRDDDRNINPDRDIWYDVSLARGVVLGDYITGREEPDNTTSIGDFM